MSEWRDDALKAIAGIKGAFNEIVKPLEYARQHRTAVALNAAVAQFNKSQKAIGMWLLRLTDALDRAPVTPAPPDPPLPPEIPLTVTLTAPTAGQSMTLPGSVSLSATTSDTNDTLRVIFKRNGAQIGQPVTTHVGGVYSASDTNPPAGVHLYSATAFDNDENETNSSSVQFTVNPEVITEPPVNVALVSRGATATPSSTVVYENYSATGPIDANPVTMWATGTPGVFPQIYPIQLHAGVAQPIGRYFLRFPNGAQALGPRAFRIEALIGGVWTTQREETNYLEATLNVPLAVAALAAEHRIVVLSAHDGSYGRITTFEAWTVGNPVPTPPYVSIDQPPSGSTVAANSNITVAATVADFDGDLDHTDILAPDSTVAKRVPAGDAVSHTFTNVPGGTNPTYAVEAYDARNAVTRKTRSVIVSPAAPAGSWTYNPAWLRSSPKTKDTWYEIAGTAPANFAAQCRPAWNPDGSLTYKKNAFWNWNGTQVDVILAIVRNILSGGHASTLGQNGAYGVDISVDDPSDEGWIAERDSTVYVTGGSNGRSHFPDGRPVARHTYDHGNTVHVGGVPKTIFAFGGALTEAGGFQWNGADCFHHDINDWDLNGAGWQLYPGPVNIAEIGNVAADYRDGKIWVFATNAGIYVLNTTSRTWSLFAAANVSSAGAGGACINTRDNLYVAGHNQRVSNFSQSGPPGLTVVNMANGQVTNQPVTGSAAQWSYGTREASPIIYDPLNHRYMHFHETTGAIVGVDATTYASSAIGTYPIVEHAGGGTVSADGPQGKIRCMMPALPVVIYVRGYNDNIRYMPLVDLP